MGMPKSELFTEIANNFLDGFEQGKNIEDESLESLKEAAEDFVGQVQDKIDRAHEAWKELRGDLSHNG